MLLCKDLIEVLIQVQPAGRFKPTCMQEVLNKIANDCKVTVNTTDFPNTMWANCASRAIRTMLYHYRRVKNNDDKQKACLSQMPRDKQEELKTFLACSCDPPKKKTP